MVFSDTNTDRVTQCASDTVYTTLVTCPITVNDSSQSVVNCSSSANGPLLNSSSVVVSPVVTCPNDISLPVLPIDYGDFSM